MHVTKTTRSSGNKWINNTIKFDIKLITRKIIGKSLELCNSGSFIISFSVINFMQNPSHLNSRK